jgi:putative hydrolase
VARGERYARQRRVVAGGDRPLAPRPVPARRQVAIEIDGSWDRQDVHYELASRALAAGCIFALDSDAHAHSELAFSEIAIAHAKLAGIPESRIVNYWSNERILEWARGAWDR